MEEEKKNSLYIVYVALMYLGALFFVTDLVLFYTEMYTDNIILTFLLCGIGISAIAFIMGIVNTVNALIHLASEQPSPLKQTFISKIILIPWYVINFMVWFILVSAFLNPFLMLAAPVIFVLGVSLTWCFMVFTGVHNISYALYLLSKKKIKMDAFLIFGIILHFVFLLDIVGAYLVKYSIERQL